MPTRLALGWVLWFCVVDTEWLIHKAEVTLAKKQQHVRVIISAIYKALLLMLSQWQSW